MSNKIAPNVGMLHKQKQTIYLHAFGGIGIYYLNRDMD